VTGYFNTWIFIYDRGRVKILNWTMRRKCNNR
jgi:hypothetical protein